MKTADTKHEDRHLSQVTMHGTRVTHHVTSVDQSSMVKHCVYHLRYLRNLRSRSSSSHSSPSICCARAAMAEGSWPGMN